MKTLPSLLILFGSLMILCSQIYNLGMSMDKQAAE
jgi:hypothetical protein